MKKLVRAALGLVLLAGLAAIILARRAGDRDASRPSVPAVGPVSREAGGEGAGGGGVKAAATDPGRPTATAAAVEAAGSTLVVKLFGPLGEPATGGAVVLVDGGPRYADEAGGGEYVLRGAPAGKFDVYVSAPGLAWTIEEVDLPRADALVLRLEEGCRIAGIVRSNDGKPVEGAAIRLAPWPAAGLFLGATDSAGRFTAALGRGPCDGGYSETIAVEAEGFAPAETDVRDLDDLEVWLFRESVVSGRILAAEDGRPVEGAVVQLSAAESSRALEAATDGEGRFEVRGVPPGSFAIAVEAEGRIPQLETLEVREGDRMSDLEFRLEKGFPLAGRVVDAVTGEPIAGAEVKAAGAEDAPQRRALTGADGRFELTGIAEGESAVFAEAPRHRLGVAEALVPAGDAEIEIPLDRSASISGRVFDADGDPAAGATVVKTRGIASARTDAAGCFIFEDCLAGSQLLRVQGKGNLVAESAPIDLADGQVLEGIEIVLPRAASIRGRVLDGNGKPVAGAKIEALTEIDRAVEIPAESGDGGEFDVGPLAKGSYRVRAVVHGHLPSPARAVDLGEGQVTKDLDLILAGGEPLRGAVVDAEDRPVRDATVTVTSGEGDAVREGTARSDGDGRFEIGGCPPGKLEIIVRRAGFAEARLGAAFVAAEVKVRLDRAARIAGKIEVTGRLAFPRAEVWIYSGDSFEPLYECVADATGRFAFSVDPGRWILTVESEGFARAAFEAVLRSGEERVLSPVLVPEGVVEGRVVSAATGEQVYADIFLEAADGSVPVPLIGLCVECSDGRFRIAGLPPGGVVVVAMGADGAKFAKSAPIRVIPGATVETEIELRGGTGIGGRIMKSLRPVTGAKVRIGRTDGTLEKETSSAPDGLFEFDGLPPGEYELSATDDAGRAAETVTTEVREGEFTGWDLQVPAR